MAFTSRSTLKSQSDAAAIQAPIAGSLTETLINTKINSESQRTDTKERIYRASFILDADINGRINPIEIIQSDATRIDLKDLIYALNEAGLDASFKETKTREGKNDKISLKVGWN